MVNVPDHDQDRPENLRDQAARCRRLARLTVNVEIARQLVELAEEFEQRALELEAGGCCI